MDASTIEEQKELLERTAETLRADIVPIAPGRRISNLWEQRSGFPRTVPARTAREQDLAREPVPLDEWVTRYGLKFGGDIRRDDFGCQYKALSREHANTMALTPATCPSSFANT